MSTPILDRFPGCIGFPVTPFTAAGELDEAAFRANVKFLLDTDLAALAFCGSNGEMQSLTLAEYERVVKIAAEMTVGKKGLIVGSGVNLGHARTQVTMAKNAGADAVIVMAPYTNDENDPGLGAYYELVAEAAEIPVVLYQTKWSGVVSLNLFESLLHVENVQMVKDENGNISHYRNVRERFGDRYFWINGMAEPFVPAYWAQGVTTYTSGLACFMPHLSVEIGKLAAAGDWEKVNQILDETVIPLYAMRNRRAGYKTSMIKAAMTLCGLEGGYVRPPLIEMSAEDRADLTKLLEARGLRSAGGESA